MKNKIISIFFYLLSIIFFSMYIYIDFFKINSFNPLFRVLSLIFICILTYFGAYFLNKYNNRYRNITYKINLLIWFILYLILILTITLFDSFFFRKGILMVTWNKIIIRDYMNYVINLIPFRTITKFIISLINKEVRIDLFLYNIFGNMIAFMPFAFFLPRLFKKQNNIKIFLITMIIIVSIIEISQFITLSGTFDIDDYILNIGGAYLMFNFLKKEKTNKLINNIIKKE